MTSWVCFQTTTVRTETPSKRHDVLLIEGASTDRQPSRKWRNIVEPIYHTAPGAPHCFVGRGPGTQHRETRADEKERRCICGSRLLLLNVGGGDYVPVIVMKDYDTRLLAAHVVLVKGADIEWASKQLVRRLVIRSDQEPALVNLLEEAAKMRGDSTTVLEHSLVGDSQGNGFIERGVRTIEEMVRTIKRRSRSNIE